MTAPLELEAHTLTDDLRVRVHLHDLDTRDGLVSCWSWLTDGLAPGNVVFTLRRALTEPARTPPDAPLAFLRTLATDPTLRAALVADALLPFAPALGSFTTASLAPALPLDGIALAPGTLAVLLLDASERTLAETVSLARIRARLGESTGHFPHPAWSDRGRPSAVSRGETLESSALAQTARLFVRDQSVLLAGDTVTLTLPRAMRTEITRVLDDQRTAPAIAFTGGFDPGADACLVWRPGQRDAIAITSADGEGERIAGVFVAFVRNVEERGVNVLEDGFAVRLSEGEWSSVATALRDGAEWARAAEGEGLAVQVRWSDAGGAAGD